MKLVMAVVQGPDAEKLGDALRAENYRATQISSAGGFLREANVTFLIGVNDDDVDHVIATVDRSCEARHRFVNPLMPIARASEPHPQAAAEVQIGGAHVFILNVRRFERLFPAVSE